MISAFIFLTFVLFLTIKYFSIIRTDIPDLEIKVINADITEPRFAINRPSQKILITAREGNFINDGKVLLKKNVKFKSNNFSLISDNVTFDREQQTAESKDTSVFKSKNTIIHSEGFNIYDNGNKINFNGNTILLLK